MTLTPSERAQIERDIKEVERMHFAPYVPLLGDAQQMQVLCAGCWRPYPCLTARLALTLRAVLNGTSLHAVSAARSEVER